MFSKILSQLFFRAPEPPAYIIFLHISSYLSFQQNRVSLYNVKEPINYIFCYFAAKIL